MPRSKRSKQHPNDNLEKRVKRVQEHLDKRALDAFLVSSTPNRFYLTGWQGDAESGFLLITPRKAFLITDSRYSEHVSNTVNHFQIIQTSEGLGPTLAKIAEKEKLQKIAFESHDLSVFDFKRLRRFLSGVKLYPVAHLIEEERAIKDEYELNLIRKAAETTNKTFNYLLGVLKPGMTEKEVATILEAKMKSLGAEKNAWEPLIVAAGENSSVPHYPTGDIRIKKRDMVLLDFGCSYGGYCSDMTRVVFLGKPDQEKIKIYNLVKDAQKIGLELVKDGRRLSQIDEKVRNFLDKGTKYTYGHGLGHGVGIAVHELPSVSLRSKGNLLAGNVVTIEPGIYIPGWGGVRIEDMVLVGKDTGTVLTKAPKAIEEVTI